MSQPTAMFQSPHHHGSLSRSILVTTASLLLMSHAGAACKFQFPGGNGLDERGTDGKMRGYDTLSGIYFNLSTVDVQGQDGSLASAGTANLTSSDIGSSGDVLGVDSVDNPSGNPNDAWNFDPGEAWMFSFDVDVKLSEIDFDDWDAATSQVTLSFANGTPDKVLFNAATATATFSLGQTLIPAGTTITLRLTNPSGNQPVSLAYLTVSAVVPTAPPVTGLVYTLGDGFTWTDVTPDFSFGGKLVVFQDGDDVIFPGPGNSATAIEAGGDGVVAGSLAWTNSTNGTLKFHGENLTADHLINTANGTVAFQNTAVINTASNYKGELEVQSGGTLTIGSLYLSGNAQLWQESGGTYHSGTTYLGAGGARIDNAAELSLGPVLSAYFRNPLKKSGTGNLTFTNGLGSSGTTPVALNILAGSVTISGTAPIHIGGPVTFNGDLIMNGPTLEIDASTIDITGTGTGTIRVRKSSFLSPHRNGGYNQDRIPVLIDAGQTLTVDPADGDNDLILTGGLGGEGNFRKQGPGLLMVDVAGQTSYTGNTTIAGGLFWMYDPILSDTGAVIFTGNGSLDLIHNQGDRVKSLFIDGKAMPAGTYGSSSVTSVGLDFVNDTRFAGGGHLIVLSGPSSNDYDAWSAGFGLAGTMADDDDRDGVANGDEYAFGLDPTSGTSQNAIAVPLDPNTRTFSYTRRNSAGKSTGVSYTYQYSRTLNNQWTDFTAAAETSDNGDPVATVTVTIPAPLRAHDRLFVRVRGTRAE